MTLESALDFLLWCLVINYGILLLWFLAFWFGHDWMFRVHSRWFHMSRGALRQHPLCGNGCV